MKLTTCYLCILTILCIPPIILTCFSLTVKFWIHYKLDLYTVIDTKGPDGHFFLTTINVSRGLFKTNYCTGTNNTQPGHSEGPILCADVDNDQWIFPADLDWILKTWDSPEKRDFLESCHAIQKTLSKSMTPLAISSLVIEVGGTLIALTFWGRRFQLLTRARWLICVVLWFVAGVLTMANTFLGLPLNQQQENGTQIALDMDGAAKKVIFGQDVDKLPKDHFTRQTVWAVFFSGTASILALITGTYVLMARHFQYPGAQNGDVITRETFSASARSHEKPSAQNMHETEALIGQNDCDAEDSVQLHERSDDSVSD